MEVVFNNLYLERLFEGKKVLGKPKYGKEVIVKFKKTVLMLQFANSVSDIKKFKGLNFEALKGDYKGYYSVRVDIQYRLILRLDKNQLFVDDIIVIEDLTNHYR
jgi:proteic killer suppression protein